ncbi:MAG: BACON domain-containing protein [Bacteroidales bacterium]|nr:BACON domain-containing protein [Bacteroidales bacterium]
MKIKNLLCSALALASLVACQEKQVILTPSSVSVDPLIVKVAADGETKTVALTANCEWETTGSAWAQVSPASGKGDTTLSILVAANEGKERDCEIVITAKDAKSSAKLLVVQAGKVQDNPGPGPGPDDPPIPDNPNAIQNAEQLATFLSQASTFASDEEFTIEADIDCGGAKISPAGSFAAILDGKDHKIYNYVIESAEATSGIFLTVSGTIKNVILGSKDGKGWDGSSTVGYVSTEAPTGHTGGVCASLSGTLQNVKNFAKVVVTMNNSGGVSGIGGLVGAMDSPSTIDGCENGGIIELSGTMANGAYAGGIVGHANNAQALIQNSVNSADLEFSLENGKYMMYGGIVGCSHVGSVVDKCQNLGDITLNQSGTETAGTYMMIAGIAGALYTGAVVTNSVNKGNVSSNRLQVSRIGGIVGTLNSKGLIEGNTNDGDVTVKHAAANNNWQAAGGICGFQEKESADNIIRNNINNGKVTVEVENATTHANKVTAGGIIGLGVLGLEISGNVNNGAVSIVNKSAGTAYAGGIVGWFKGAGSFTKENENKGAVSCKTSDDAAAVAGGVVGYSSDAANTCTSDKNKGAVTCANTPAVGSIAGTNAGSLNNCQAGGSVNGTALTDANFASLTQGTSSTGTATGTTLAK